MPKRESNFRMKREQFWREKGSHFYPPHHSSTNKEIFKVKILNYTSIKFSFVFFLNLGENLGDYGNGNYCCGLFDWFYSSIDNPQVRPLSFQTLLTQGNFGLSLI